MGFVQTNYTLKENSISYRGGQKISNKYYVYTAFYAGTKKPQLKCSSNENIVEFQQVIDGTQGRGRTGTPVKTRDFKKTV